MSRKNNNNNYKQNSEDMMKKINNFQVDLDSERMSNAILAKELANLTLTTLNSVTTGNRNIFINKTLPKGMSESEFETALNDIPHNEQVLRGLSYKLGGSEFTYKNLLKVQQDILTYRSYVYPKNYNIFSEKKNDAEFKKMIDEMIMLEDANEMMGIESTFHAVTGKGLNEGKAFYYHQYGKERTYTKFKDKIVSNFLKEIPSDYVKIIGRSEISKYRVAFDLMYFMNEDTNFRDFGDLFLPFINDFDEVLTFRNTNVMGNSKTSVSLNENQFNDLFYNNYGNNKYTPKIGKNLNSKFSFGYWVTLPEDKVWTFEIDDTVDYVAPIYTGLFSLQMKQKQVRDTFIQLIQNPLASTLTGQIETEDNKTVVRNNTTKVGVDVKRLYEIHWYEMLRRINLNGIGGFFAPFKDMKLHQLSEAPNSDKTIGAFSQLLSGTGGMGGVIPSDGNTLAGQVAANKATSTRFCEQIYRTAERMMQTMYKNLDLQFTWGFSMFGNVFDDKEELDGMKQSMTLGILPDIFRYNALLNRNLSSDISMSKTIMHSGLLDLRIPLISSYSAKNENGLSPQATDVGRDKVDRNKIADEQTEESIDKGLSATI